MSSRPPFSANAKPQPPRSQPATSIIHYSLLLCKVLTFELHCSYLSQHSPAQNFRAFHLSRMAWVRPKHPPPKKPKPDPIVTLLPMLSYFSSSRPPPPLSPTKAKPQHASAAPLSRDPILRSLQQTQAAHEDEPRCPDPVDEELRPKQHQTKHHAPSRPPCREEYDEVASRRSRTVRQNHRDPSPFPPPSPPPPLPLALPRPRVASYERHQPVQVVRERYSPRPTDYPSYQTRMASKATSARWASATAPLDIR